jgi:hypothetical protein
MSFSFAISTNRDARRLLTQERRREIEFCSELNTEASGAEAVT